MNRSAVNVFHPNFGRYFLGLVVNIVASRNKNPSCSYFLSVTHVAKRIVAKPYIVGSRQWYRWIERRCFPIGCQLLPCLYLQRFGRNFQCNVAACSHDPRAPINRIVS